MTTPTTKFYGIPEATARAITDAGGTVTARRDMGAPFMISFDVVFPSGTTLVRNQGGPCGPKVATLPNGQRITADSYCNVASNPDGRFDAEPNWNPSGVFPPSQPITFA